MQAQYACQINIETAKSESSQKQQNIDYQQVLHHRWQHLKSRWTELLTHLNKSSILNNT